MAREIARRKRPRIGDVVEIVTPKGLAYAQYTHNHKGRPHWGHLSWSSGNRYVFPVPGMTPFVTDVRTSDKLAVARSILTFLVAPPTSHPPCR